jgi:methyl-accepting chemotaxis protein
MMNAMEEIAGGMQGINSTIPKIREISRKNKESIDVLLGEMGRFTV